MRQPTPKSAGDNDEDLCFDCAPDATQNTIADQSAGAEPFYEICAACGPGWFDRDGRKVRDATPQELTMIRLLFGGVI